MDKKVISMVAGFVCLSTIPVPAEATVRINEIAWMGTADNANAEWIEFFNTDETPASLSGWTLSASNGSPFITLTGSIAGRGFYLAERTSDDTVSNVTAGKIYTGALTNTGATLILKDAAGVVVDEVVGGTNWSAIGGSNETKHTPQRNTDGTAWTTAPSTPGSVNEEAVTGEAASSEKSIPSTPVFPRIYIDGLKDVTVSTFDTLEPEVLVYEKEVHQVRQARIQWAFGDGSQEFGYRPSHIYEYPGEYVVDVRVESNNLKVDDSFIVTVDDADIRIVENSVRGIGLYNADDRIVSLSNWHLKLGEALYDLPEGTQILPGRTVLFPVAITGLDIFSYQVSVLYPSGKTAATLIQTFAVKSF